jgi:hypothetical protein
VPKKKSQRKSLPQPTNNVSTTKPWVRWASIVVVLAILISVMLAAMSTSPSSAATNAPVIMCEPNDTDSDGIMNDNDSDIDGDGLVNAQDDDMDGDGTMNADDTDMAATNCGMSTTKPNLNEELNHDGSPRTSEFSWQWAVGLIAIGFGYLTLRQTRKRK